MLRQGTKPQPGHSPVPPVPGTVSPPHPADGTKTIPGTGMGFWEMHIGGQTHQCRVGGVAPALGPHQIQSVQGRILILREPPCTTANALPHHCIKTRGREDSDMALVADRTGRCVAGRL